MNAWLLTCWVLNLKVKGEIDLEQSQQRIASVEQKVVRTEN